LVPGGGFESPSGFLFVEAVDLDDLSAVALTRRKPNRGGRDAERLGQKSDQRRVRPPALRRRCDAHLPAVSMASDDRVCGGAGRESYKQPQSGGPESNRRPFIGERANPLPMKVKS
jgi:hypothetical protein